MPIPDFEDKHADLNAYEGFGHCKLPNTRADPIHVFAGQNQALLLRKRNMVYDGSTL